MEYELANYFAHTQRQRIGVSNLQIECAHAHLNCRGCKINERKNNLTQYFLRSFPLSLTVIDFGSFIRGATDTNTFVHSLFTLNHAA